MADVSATLSCVQAVFAISEIGLPLLNENCRGAHGTEARQQFIGVLRSNLGGAARG
jgi:hypothetical protein